MTVGPITVTSGNTLTIEGDVVIIQVDFMGTLRVDNLQKEDGSAVITDGTINGTLTETTLRNSGVGMVKIFSQSNQSAASEYDIDLSLIHI